jgi:hypothetical protein
MDLWNSATRDSFQFEHRNPPALLIQDSPIHSERTLVHKQSQHPWRSTSEHSAQWNIKYLRKLENHTTELDNNETTQTEKVHRPNSTRPTWVNPK